MLKSALMKILSIVSNILTRQVILIDTGQLIPIITRVEKMYLKGFFYDEIKMILEEPFIE